VAVATGPVALQRRREQPHAGVGDAHRLAAGVVALPRQHAGGEQLDLDRVQARPAGRAPDRAQPAPVRAAEPFHRVRS